MTSQLQALIAKVGGLEDTLLGLHALVVQTAKKQLELEAAIAALQPTTTTTTTTTQATLAPLTSLSAIPGTPI